MAFSEEPGTSPEKGPETVARAERTHFVQGPRASAVSNSIPFPEDPVRSANVRRFPITVPEGYKLVHVMRHARAWHK
jgi:hypothetical protein